VDGVAFTAWLTLIPPAEGALGSCRYLIARLVPPIAFIIVMRC
jgi:hypothetical protein